jgi:hypothetical protein
VQWAAYIVLLFMPGAYDVQAQTDQAAFSFRVGNRTETLYLMYYKYFWLLLSVGVFAWFRSQYVALAEAQRSVEQRWLLLLTAALVLFNDPLYAVEIQTGGALLRVTHAAFESVFWASLLFFWLVVMDWANVESRMHSASVNSRKFFAPKVFFVVAFWISSVAVLGERGADDELGEGSTGSSSGSALEVLEVGGWAGTGRRLHELQWRVRESSLGRKPRVPTAPLHLHSKHGALLCPLAPSCALLLSERS